MRRLWWRVRYVYWALRRLPFNAGLWNCWWAWSGEWDVTLCPPDEAQLDDTYALL